MCLNWIKLILEDRSIYTENKSEHGQCMDRVHGDELSWRWEREFKFAQENTSNGKKSKIIIILYSFKSNNFCFLIKAFFKW